MPSLFNEVAGMVIGRPDLDLTHKEQVYLCVLARFSNAEGVSVKSQAALAEAMGGVDPRTIRNYNASLQEKGFIRVEERRKPGENSDTNITTLLFLDDLRKESSTPQRKESSNEIEDSTSPLSKSNQQKKDNKKEKSRDLYPVEENFRTPTGTIPGAFSGHLPEADSSDFYDSVRARFEANQRRLAKEPPPPMKPRQAPPVLTEGEGIREAERRQRAHHRRSLGRAS